jgi:hypothetical protein
MRWCGRAEHAHVRLRGVAGCCLLHVVREFLELCLEGLDFLAPFVERLLRRRYVRLIEVADGSELERSALARLIELASKPAHGTYKAELRLLVLGVL